MNNWMRWLLVILAGVGGGAGGSVLARVAELPEPTLIGGAAGGLAAGLVAMLVRPKPA